MALIQSRDALSTIPPALLGEQPFGTAYLYQPDAAHGVSMSLPTWNSIVDYFEKGEEWKKDRIEWCYPRFFINRPIRDLAHRAWERLKKPIDGEKACLLFPTAKLAWDCARHIVKGEPDIAIDIVSFQCPKDCDESTAPVLNVASFAMLVFPEDVKPAAKRFWMIAGGGITTRHAIFTQDYVDYLEVVSGDQTIKTSPPQAVASLDGPSWIRDSRDAITDVKARIADLASSPQSSRPRLSPEHVTLYPTGMSAIYHTSQSVEAVAKISTVVAFGWIYSETTEILRDGRWQNFIGYKRGTEEDLEHLSRRLGAGQRIGALFCELPSNVFLSSVALRRLRALAVEYDFIIACDDTVASFINLDLLPYVDVLMTSLTKIFSGASNVTGGSVICNPASRYYASIQPALQARHLPSFIFPLDIEALNRNSHNVRWRVQRCNENALAVAQMLHGHPLIERVNYPFFDETRPIYEDLMRRDGAAGYGPVLSMVFHDEDVARTFYDALNLPKGSSFGNNFTLAVPFTLLVYYFSREKVAAYGLPEHVIRMSVGLEDVRGVKRAIQTALGKCLGGN